MNKHEGVLTDFEDILPTYETLAGVWAKTRDQSLYEAPVLAEALAGQKGAKVLDLGCGTGVPIARWFLGQGAKVTGVDGAAAMVAAFRHNLPLAHAVKADMRQLSLGRKFDVILGWDSFFHLSAADQRTMFSTFSSHATPGARLLLTTGDRPGIAIGAVGDKPVIHDSLSPEEYRACFRTFGWHVQWFRPNDPALWQRSVWLATYRGK